MQRGKGLIRWGSVLVMIVPSNYPCLSNPSHPPLRPLSNISSLPFPFWNPWLFFSISSLWSFNFKLPGPVTSSWNTHLPKNKPPYLFNSCLWYFLSLVDTRGLQKLANLSLAYWSPPDWSQYSHPHLLKSSGPFQPFFSHNPSCCCPEKKFLPTLPKSLQPSLITMENFLQVLSLPAAGNPEGAIQWPP